MKFNDTFEELLSIYTEGYNPKDKAYNRTPEEQAEIDKKKAQFKKNSEKLAKEEPIPTIGTTGGASPAPRKRSEDNETAKKVAKVAGKAIKGTAKLAVKGALKAGKELGHFVTDDNFRGKRSDEEVEDCETCGCEENPEYGHFDDQYSKYIDQYKVEDAERVDKDRMK